MMARIDFTPGAGESLALDLWFGSGGDGVDTRDSTAALLAGNPSVRFYNGQRGYVRCELTPARCRTDYRVLEYVTRPGSPISTRASFVVEDGRPGAQRL